MQRDEVRTIVDLLGLDGLEGLGGLGLEAQGIKSQVAVDEVLLHLGNGAEGAVAISSLSGRLPRLGDAVRLDGADQADDEGGKAKARQLISLLELENRGATGGEEEIRGWGKRWRRQQLGLWSAPG